MATEVGDAIARSILALDSKHYQRIMQCFPLGMNWYAWLLDTMEQ